MTMIYRFFRALPLLSSLALPGCVIDLGGDLGDTIESRLEGACIGVDVRTQSVTIDEPIHAVVVENGVGDITVRTHDASGAQVDAELFGDDLGDGWMRVEAGVLYVGTSCDGCCGGDLTLAVPAQAELTVDLSVGDVEIRDLRGKADVHVGTGDIELDQVGGELVLDVNTGSIDGKALTGSKAAANIGTGDISLTYDPSAPLEAVTVDLGVGAVELRVPAGTYALDLDPGVGAVSVEGLEEVYGARRRIHVNVGTGDIDVEGR